MASLCQRGNPRPAAGCEPSRRGRAATGRVLLASWCSLPSPKATRSLGWDSRAGDASYLHHSLGAIVLGPSAIRPFQRLLQPLWPELQRKPLLVGVPRDAAPALGKRLRLAMRAAGRDLVAPGHRVPGRLRPLDCAVVGQGVPGQAAFELLRDGRRDGVLPRPHLSEPVSARSVARNKVALPTAVYHA